jgi:hypothetical protein
MNERGLNPDALDAAARLVGEVAADKRELDPAGQRPDADLINTGQEPEDTVVVRLRSVFAKPNRLFKLVAVDLGRFVGVSHFGDGADGRLRRHVVSASSTSPLIARGGRTPGRMLRRFALVLL